jgi:hypothetical protein
MKLCAAHREWMQTKLQLHTTICIIKFWDQADGTLAVLACTRLARDVGAFDEATDCSGK